MKIKISRHTLLGITVTTALIIAIATAAPQVQKTFQGIGPSNVGFWRFARRKRWCSQLIVKPRAQVGAKLAGALQSLQRQRFIENRHVSMRVFRPMSGHGLLIKLDEPV